METCGCIWHGNSVMYIRDSPTLSAMGEMFSEHLT